MDQKTIFKLETADRKRRGTLCITTCSAIFARRTSLQINDTERRVIRMIEDDESPSCWRCGCVTGYPYSMFTQVDQELLARYGLDHRFDI